MGYIGKIANWYFSRKALPIWGILLIDNAIVFGSIAFMFLFYNTENPLSIIYFDKQYIFSINKAVPHRSLFIIDT